MKSRLEKRRIYADLTCTTCEGAGMYLHPEGGMAHCECHLAEKKRVLMRHAGFPPLHRGCTVSNYIPMSEAEVNARPRIISWVKNFKPGCTGLYLHGSPGTGKTHLLVAMGKAIIDQHGIEVMYSSAANMLEEASRLYRKAGGDHSIFENPFDAAAEVPVLLLDDMGAEKVSEWVLAMFYRLINTRYNRNLTTLITSNVPLSEFEQVYDARIADRIHAMCSVVHCDGPSRRREDVKS